MKKLEKQIKGKKSQSMNVTMFHQQLLKGEESFISPVNRADIEW